MESVQSDQHVVDREKEIAKYLQRMERVLTQAERMHNNTHVQPARRRHSLSNSQVVQSLALNMPHSCRMQHRLVHQSAEQG